MAGAYYDHENAYQRIAAGGGRGWDDRAGGGGAGAASYAGLDEFLVSELCPAARGAGGAGGAARAVDLGCGGGQGTIRLAQRGFAATGVDAAPTALMLARENAAAAAVEAKFRLGDCLDLAAFGAGSFALAVDNHTLHCILGADRRRFLREVVRILAPGGVLFSETMSAEGTPEFGALGVDPATRVDRSGTRYWAGRTELLEEFATSGLDVVSVQARPQRERPDPGDLLAVVARKPAACG